jgi:redox-sensitive bicupin YhaK (pirin superfamily)
MRTLRRSDEREQYAQGKQQGWLTFPVLADVAAHSGGFGGLVLLNEDRLPPGGSLRSRPTRDLEIVTYVREGALTFRDAMGGAGVLLAGEFQCSTAESGVRRTQSNPSHTHAAHVFQIFLQLARAGTEPSQERQRVSAAERRGGLRFVAAPDGRAGSLRVCSDSLVYSALLDRGKHVVHALLLGRGAWVHIVKGAATLDELVLNTGDGAGVTAERAVSLTAREDTELLLLDVSLATNGGHSTSRAPNRPE